MGLRNLVEAKPDARVFFAGRSKEEIRYYLRKTVEFQKERYRRRLGEFMDKDGLSGFYREGRWFFQKYHDDADVMALCNYAGLKVITFKSDRSMWQVEAMKERELNPEQIASAIGSRCAKGYPSSSDERRSAG
ncbi:hypothetical protein [Mesorhizobium sp. dw_380]|uniref:hypothetical protein n=1 Tax=Mesorhizobium sp. dw_380 TaxID=2812001 RepID=UPI001BDEDF91|nr:hypothetical protein [Mesorhizobium sp. dw_380]